MSMELQKKHIKHKKIIGKSEDQEVHLLTTYGGLQIIMKMTNGKPEILGAGAHVAHAKFQAEQKLKNKITWTDE
jgi:hypothetical protein